MMFTIEAKSHKAYVKVILSRLNLHQKQTLDISLAPKQPVCTAVHE